MTSARSHEQPALPMFETGQPDYFPAAPGESLSPYDHPELAGRLAWLRENHGFMPTSQGEANEAYGLAGPKAADGNAASRLAAIEGRQYKKGVDSPEVTVRAVASEYAEYAWKARVDSWQLRTLAEDLTSQDAGRSLRQVDPVGGVPQLVRYYDLRRLVAEGIVVAEGANVLEPFVRRDGGQKRSALDPYTTSTPSKAMRDHLGGMAGTITVGRAQQLLPEAVTDQQERETFWVERLREARTHRVARPIATAALERMKIEF